MTREEAIAVLNHNVSACLHGTEWGEALDMAIETLSAEPCEDCISRESALLSLTGMNLPKEPNKLIALFNDRIQNLSSVQPKARVGHWERMSDLPQEVDDRYKCSCCGNVVHYDNGIHLYTFNRWCGRCGSDNGRK